MAKRKQIPKKPKAILLSRTEPKHPVTPRIRVADAEVAKPKQKAKKAQKIPAKPKISAKSKRPSRWQRVAVTVTAQWFQRTYLIGSLVLLAATTVFWAVIGARLHAVNADQLVDPYLFSSANTLQGAAFPGAHTLLFKWPIFWVVSLFGVSTASLLWATVGVSLATVLALAFILYKIDKRPLVFGTICLFLALMLLMVPPQPYIGALLPVNMAMLTTRNLEYVLYIIGILFVIWAGRFRSKYSIAAVGWMTLLIASDKLFAGLGVGSALLLIVTYALVHNWHLVRLGVRWLCTVLASMVLATLLLAGLQLAGVAHFASEANVSPYQLTSSPQQGVLGVVYGVGAFLVNFGANPAYAANTLRAIPQELKHGLFGWGGVVYGLAFVALCYGLVQVWHLLRPTLRAPKGKAVQPTVARDLSIILLASTATAFVIFIATQHYYAVDARYIAIALFAVFIAVATSLRTRTFRLELLTLCGALAVLGLVLGVFSAKHTYSQSAAALSDLKHRSAVVAQALEHHKVTVLAGDYWRVLPARFAADHDFDVMPFSGCTQPAQVLTSSAWQPDLQKSSFAYLLSLDASLTNYPHCTLEQVVQAYGRPNASLVISGTLSDPKELVLFYDHGINQAGGAEATSQLPPSTVLPVGLADLPNTVCDGNTTIMTVVAHQDDDLLFTSPDLLHDLQDGHCMRTVFLTAGDSGSNKFYWINRQLGAQAAYDSMLGKKDVWVQRIVRLDSQRYFTVSSPKSNPKISLVFFNLPDGNLHGNGFETSAYESLTKLYAGQLQELQTVDRQSVYTSAELVQALSSLMSVYQPAELHTQADTYSAEYPDHSDHITAGHFAVDAANQYDQVQFGGNFAIPVKRYIGYPVRSNEQNVGGEDLARKEAAFLAYAQFDGGVCQSAEQCAETPTYGSYITRQYIDGE